MEGKGVGGKGVIVFSTKKKKERTTSFSGTSLRYVKLRSTNLLFYKTTGTIENNLFLNEYESTTSK